MMLQPEHRGPLQLSAVIITRDEERRLPACLDSLRGLADEMIVVDDHSRDRTRRIAADRSARIYARHFDWSARQMNYGLEQARAPWVLIIDADERLSDELKREIRTVLLDPGEYRGFFLPRQNHVFGRWLRHGGNYPDYNAVRLFRRGCGRFQDQPIHSPLELDGRAGYLRVPLLHDSYRNLHEYYSKFNSYTSLEAEGMRRKGRRFSWTRMLGIAGGHFARRLLWQSAYLDGWPGVVYCLLGLHYDLVRFWKLRERETAMRLPARTAPAAKTELACE